VVHRPRAPPLPAAPLPPLALLAAASAHPDALGQGRRGTARRGAVPGAPCWGAATCLKRDWEPIECAPGSWHDYSQPQRCPRFTTENQKKPQKSAPCLPIHARALSALLLCTSAHSGWHGCAGGSHAAGALGNFPPSGSTTALPRRHTHWGPLLGPRPPAPRCMRADNPARRYRPSFLVCSTPRPQGAIPLSYKCRGALFAPAPKVWPRPRNFASDLRARAARAGWRLHPARVAAQPLPPPPRAAGRALCTLNLCPSATHFGAHHAHQGMARMLWLPSWPALPPMGGGAAAAGAEPPPPMRPPHSRRPPRCVWGLPLPPPQRMLPRAGGPLFSAPLYHCNTRERGPAGAACVCRSLQILA
jgi:hypothetical protein